MPACTLIAFLAVTGVGRMLLLLPLSLAIAVVYKTTRCENLREVPGAVAALWLTLVLGMYAVGVAIWLLFMICVEWT